MKLSVYREHRSCVAANLAEADQKRLEVEV